MQEYMIVRNSGTGAKRITDKNLSQESAERLVAQYRQTQPQGGSKSWTIRAM